MEIIFVVNTEGGNLQVLIIEWAGAGRGDEKLGQFVLRDCNNKLITILSTRTHFKPMKLNPVKCCTVTLDVVSRSSC